MKKLSKVHLSRDEHFGDWIQVHDHCIGTQKTGTDVMLSFTSIDDPRYPLGKGIIEVFLTESKAMELLGQLQAWADANTTLADQI